MERPIAVGGMATAFLAEDLQHHRSVAIEVLDPGLADALVPVRVPRDAFVRVARPRRGSLCVRWRPSFAPTPTSASLVCTDIRDHRGYGSTAQKLWVPI